jgi:hypothetical protein
VRNDDYGELRAACAAVMGWAAPGWHYSGVAVTKNFVASPHIDERDCTPQFAVSLGDFTGGELCVEAGALEVTRPQIHPRSWTPTALHCL